MMAENPVLIVDDEEYIIKTITRILRSGGYTNIISLGDSRKVLDLLRKQPVEAVLLDLTMPHISGHS